MPQYHVALKWQLQKYDARKVTIFKFLGTTKINIVCNKRLKTIHLYMCTLQPKPVVLQAAKMKRSKTSLCSIK